MYNVFLYIHYTRNNKLSLATDIQKKPNKILYNKITKPSEIFKLKEIQEIKDAIQEHLLFLGLYNRKVI